MDVDIELYRREVRISDTPLVRLSAIDIAPSRPRRTMVFVHGLGGSASQWRYQLQNFSDDSRVLAIDLRGHGQSDRPHAAYDMASVQADLAAAATVELEPPEHGGGARQLHRDLADLLLGAEGGGGERGGFQMINAGVHGGPLKIHLM